MQDEWALQQEIARARREAEEWKIRAETADMDEEEKYKYLYERSQADLARLQWEQGEFVNRMGQRQRMADLAGIDAGELAQGRISRKKKAAQPSPVPPQAPQAPTSKPDTAAQEIMAMTPLERRKRLEKMHGDELEKFMESLGEE